MDAEELKTIFRYVNIPGSIVIMIKYSLQNENTIQQQLNYSGIPK